MNNPPDHQGSHFVNQTIKVLTEELQVQHKLSTPYHLQENGTIEAFNKILETTLTKLVYGKEEVMLMEYIVPILRIVAASCMADAEALEEHVA